MNMSMQQTKVVRSPGSDPGHHEEFRNGPEVKNYIWEVEFRPSGKFRGSPVLYRDHRKGPGGLPGGATYPGGPHGLKWEGNQPLVGWCAPPWPPLRLGLGTLGEGAPPLALGGVLHPLAAAPPRRSHLLGPMPPLGSLYKEGGGRAAAPLHLAPPSPLLHLSLSQYNGEALLR